MFHFFTSLLKKRTDYPISPDCKSPVDVTPGATSRLIYRMKIKRQMFPHLIHFQLISYKPVNFFLLKHFPHKKHFHFFSKLCILLPVELKSKIINGRECELETQETCHHLMNQIDSKRDLMISMGITKGLGSLETIQYSQELDKLIIRFQKNCDCWNKFLLLD